MNKDSDQLKHINYCISSVIRVKDKYLPFQNNLKGLDPICKMNLDIWNCIARENPILLLNYTRLNLHICSNFGGVNSSFSIK